MEKDRRAKDPSCVWRAVATIYLSCPSRDSRCHGCCWREKSGECLSLTDTRYLLSTYLVSHTQGKGDGHSTKQAFNMALSSSSSSTVQALSRANLGILRQKLSLMGVMKTRFGDAKAKTLYAKVCPLVNASIGQHIRHSMDHLELAAQMAADRRRLLGGSGIDKKELHYDLRERGGEDENDIDEAMKRIETVVDLLNDISSQSTATTTASTSTAEDDDANNLVQACFMLSADSTEFHLPSTVEREMGFAAHHAIHHLALVKIIAEQTLGIPSESLSSDFGKAPSTIAHDNQQHPPSSTE